MPTVSVIMPAYNVEPYLADAAATALAQTYSDLELIIVDDGSKDATGQIAEEVRRLDPERVRVVSKPNGGLSSARNAAMRVATGQFFALLDSDDLWEPEFLASQMSVFARDPGADLVTTNAKNLGGPRDGFPARPWAEGYPAITLATILADEEAVFIMTVFRRRVWETIGEFDERLATNEDYDYWIRAAARGFRFARNPCPLAWYRRRADSLSSNEARMLAGILKVLEKARIYCPVDSPERDILERQVVRFTAEHSVAEARQALTRGDVALAARWIESLATQRGDKTTRFARFVARYAPALLRPIYQIKRRWVVP
jgi:glycosyltransferase involved in cell wall biosynthesis